ncbi:MAG: S41 family peptidase [Planctomycetes bacterium]|nr:S41 family peptidase [Planctomycetota bacterium]
MSRWNLAWLLGISAGAILGISLTYSAPTPQGNLQQRQQNLKLLVDVLDEIEKKYVKELDQKKMRELVENMINGGLEKLDPHSGFISADEFKQFQQRTRGKFGGVGIRLGVDPRSGRFMVESPIAGTPAYDAGVMAGDLILKIDGKSIDEWILKKVVEHIQGDPNTDVTLTVLHENGKEPVDLKMTRAEIKVESVMGDTYDKINLKEWNFWVDPESKIAYVRITEFTGTTVEELTRVVDGLQKAGLQGLIIDLRTNPGGLLEAAVDAASLFLPEGKAVVSTKGRGGVVEKEYKAKIKGNMKPGTSYPIAVLINRNSASASEILAAALQDHARAVIIGERSYGKGSVQVLIEMEEGTTALKLTTASYWRPSGRNIHRFPDSKDEDEWGVKPTKGFEVKLTDAERFEYFKWRRERDILRRPGQAPKKADGDAKDKKEFRDRVMDKAIEHLRAEIAKDGKRDARAPADPAARPAPAAEAPPQALPRRTVVADGSNRSYRDIVR